MDIKKILKDTAILTVICLISGLLLGLAYEITSPIIAQRLEDEKKASYMGVFAEAADMKTREDLLEEAAGVLSAAGHTVEITDIMEVSDASGAVIGYAMSIATSGYKSGLTIAYGYAVDGTTTGIEILTSQESAGLGALASEPAFKGQFTNKLVEAFSVVKGSAAADNEIAAISGATRTTDGVVAAVNAGITFGKYCTENQ